MFEILSYDFMQRAFIVGTLLGIILPCLGMTILLKRLSMMGDSLSHASLAGVTIGIFAGINPLIGSIFICIFAGLFVEFIRNKLKAYEEISTLVILSASVGLAGIFSSLSGNATNISSFLFGSIVTITKGEFYGVLIISVLLLAVYSLIYKDLYLSVFDREGAKLMGIKTGLIDFIFTILSALAISLAAKTIGSLIVSSLLIIPTITAMALTKTYKGALILSIGLCLLYMYSGLLISYNFNLKPGSVIVLIGVVSLVFTLMFNKK